MKGKFITVEGCEGVGKTTQINSLIEYLESCGKSVFHTREPGGNVISEQLRSVILNKENFEMDSITELLLYIASRRQLTEEIIRKKLYEYDFVICDRYIDSTLAYQGYGRGLDKQLIQSLNKLAMGDITIDMTLFFDLNPVAAFKRKGGADPFDRLESENIEFHQRVYEGYKQIARDNPDRVTVIDASDSKDAITARITKALKDKGFI